MSSTMVARADEESNTCNADEVRSATSSGGSVPQTPEELPSSTDIMDDMLPIPSLSTSPGRASPPTLPQVMHLKRPNPKRLALSLSLPTSSSPISSVDTVTPTPLTITPTTDGWTPSTSNHSTPYTPGPPRTPALALQTGLSSSLGRAASKASRRPSLLSLITQPPTNADHQTPPTPSVCGHPYATVRRTRARSNTDDVLASTSARPPLPDLSRSAYPSLGRLSEAGEPSLTSLGFALQAVSSSSTPGKASSHRSSPSSDSQASVATTSDYARPAEPYADGPVEVVPGLWLGSEESVEVFVNGEYGAAKGRVRVMNVAQEVPTPFGDPDAPSASSSSGGERKVELAEFEQDEEVGRGVKVEYAHLKWSHGEGGLAEMPDCAGVPDLLSPHDAESGSGTTGAKWGFREALRWLEQGRREGVPVLVHCQCGVSRSATLAIAYVMALAACGVMPEALGHLTNMQEAYDFVKAKSGWVGPNVSLVMQLVEFQKALTTMLSRYPLAGSIDTSWPKSSDMELSEAEWARRRREFEERENSAASYGLTSSPEDISGGGQWKSPISPEEAEGEAQRLDEAMRWRRRERLGDGGSDGVVTPA